MRTGERRRRARRVAGMGGRTVRRRRPTLRWRQGIRGPLWKDLKTDQGMSVGPRYVELAFGCPPIEWDIDMRVRDFADRMGDEYTSLYEKGETGIKGGDFERFGAFVDNHLDFMCALTKARAWIPSAATGRSAHSSTHSTSSPQCPNHHRRHRKRTIFLPAYAIRPAR